VRARTASRALDLGTTRPLRHDLGLSIGWRHLGRVVVGGDPEPSPRPRLQEVADMASVLILYGTTEGQTARIAEYVAEAIRESGHASNAVDVRSSGGTVPDGCDAVVIGAAIHMGKHDKHVVEFVRNNRDTLERLPSAFFSVSLAAHGDLDEAQGYLEHFEDETGWHPDKVALFAGALPYTQYGFIKRRMMKRIVQDKPGHLGVDTSRDYVYTEWDGVKRFAEDFAADLSEHKTPGAVPTRSPDSR
jgi:menaquinone-dependent protoporphyrinogen oxidase